MNRLVSRLKKIGLLCVLFPIAIVVSILSIIQLCFSYIFSDGERGWEIIIGYDRLGNIFLGGKGVETFSARCYRSQSKKYRKIQKYVDKLFQKVANEENHCKNAFDNEMTSSQRHFEKYKHLL